MLRLISSAYLQVEVFALLWAAAGCSWQSNEACGSWILQ